MRIAIAGLGLIGASFAKAIKAYTGHIVAGYDISAEVAKTALQDGCIDEITDRFSGYDLVLVALYPTDTILFLNHHIDSFAPHTLVVDCCGVKKSICTQVWPLFQGREAFFLGAHPMAGREQSGYPAALPTLFDNASMILTPDPHFPESLLALAKALFLSLGFGRITITSPEHHDQIIAYTSQLAHVVSSAYMQSPTAREFIGFSAGSFADLTRVAKLNPTMWAELFLCNQEALISEIDSLISSLQHYRNAIEQGDRLALQEILARGSKIKESLSKDVK